MTLISTFSAKSIGLAMGLFALVSTASASEYKMHVPVAASWGGQMLPAGDYIIDIGPASPIARVFTHGKQGTLFVTSVTPTPSHEHSSLQLVDVGGTQTVKGFDSQEQGLAFKFVLPKAAISTHNTTVASISGY